MLTPPSTPLHPSTEQNQLRAQAQEIGRLQSTVDTLVSEKAELQQKLDAPPANQIVNSILRSFTGSEALRLESVEEKVHCNSYKSHTDVRYRFFGAPGRFRGSFPDIHNAKVEIATPESFGDAVKAQFEFKPLQPITTSKSRFSLDVGDLLGIKGAPTLVVSPNPPFLINNRTEWNPQVEMQGETEDGIEWELRYTVSNDGAVLRSLEGELNYSHDVYGDFTLSRWLHEDDMELWDKYGDWYGDSPGGLDSRYSGDPRGGSGDDDTDSDRSGSRTPRRVSPRRALWGRGSKSPRGISPAESARSGRSARSSRSRRSFLGDVKPPTPRWLASWRREVIDRDGVTGSAFEAKVGDAAAVANENAHKSGGNMSTAGGIINADNNWVTSDSWELELGARRRLQHNLDGKIAARFVARELEAGMSYHFTEEFKGWHVNAKAVLSPQGISTPEFTLHHVWDF